MQTWADETVVYDARSGNTHLLSAAAVQVLAAIMHAPADLDSLVASLLDSQPDPAPERISGDVRENAETILAELAAISLINSVVP